MNFCTNCAEKLKCTKFNPSKNIEIDIKKNNVKQWLTQDSEGSKNELVLGARISCSTHGYVNILKKNVLKNNLHPTTVLFLRAPGGDF